MLKELQSADKIELKTKKVIYIIIGHFNKFSNMTAKDKLERLIKKEIEKIS